MIYLFLPVNIQVGSWFVFYPIRFLFLMKFCLVPEPDHFGMHYNVSNVLYYDWNIDIIYYVTGV